ncbi:DUF4956 domain-containing protein [Solirubrobacter taibaiensis]|nr:DUF4956 domain-containing protein [Solirubrobacter taibaiensis]
MLLQDLLMRLGLDALALAALLYGLFLPRHKRMDLVVVYTLFNLGLFLALVVISQGQVSMGVGFGLFAVLSIVRLRSEPYSNRELAYFFVAIVLALVCAIDIGNLALAGVLVATVLLAAWAVDHPRLTKPVRHLRVTLDRIVGDDALHDVLEERLGGRVLDATVLEVDYVRETTVVDVRLTTQREEAGHVVVA